MDQNALGIDIKLEILHEKIYFRRRATLANWKTNIENTEIFFISFATTAQVCIV